MKDGKPLVLIGLGNRMRRDDGVGLWVAQYFQAHGWPPLKVFPLGVPDPVALAQAWAGAEIAWIVDAAVAEVPPGTILRIRGEDLLTDRRERWLSTHGLALREAIIFARMLEASPSRMVVYGIVGRDFRYGEGLTPDVEASARRLIRRLERIILRVCNSQVAFRSALS
ncbi:hydrogenase maturation protease [Thermoflexus sp.]|uniref:hydrogenase maturation protease n=1 Tax=Thermoflexus sp. TaxID=1969742 RepID=UPI0035E40311